MRLFWISLAAAAIVALAFIMFFENLPDLCYNLFHKTKRPINWDPRCMKTNAEFPKQIELDDFEMHYHEN